MNKKYKSRKSSFAITQKFKYWLILILISAVGLRLYFMFVLGAEGVVTEKLVLFLALFVMTFIWKLEGRDRERLLTLNAELIKAREKILEANINTVKSLVSTLEAKDPYTKGHCERVTNYAIKIAEAMNLDEGYISVLRNAASIHDIGKLGISDDILHKPGKLDDNQWDIIKRHPSDGVNIVSTLDFLDKEKEIILHHHERFDGRGYPDGLKEEEIPLGAKILAVADSFDAMNSTRPYRSALSNQEIIKELEKGKGQQFDPEIADVFLNVIRNNGVEIKSHKDKNQE